MCLIAAVDYTNLRQLYIETWDELRDCLRSLDSVGVHGKEQKIANFHQFPLATTMRKAHLHEPEARDRDLPSKAAMPVKVAEGPS